MASSVINRNIWPVASARVNWHRGVGVMRVVIAGATPACYTQKRRSESACIFKGLGGRSGWVRILPPQPASPIFGDSSCNVAKKAAIGGLSDLGGVSPAAKFDIYWARRAENLRASLALWPFSGEPRRRLGSIELRDRVASVN